MRGWIFLIAFAIALSSCRNLASQKEVRKTLSAQSEACGVDVSALGWSTSSGKSILTQSRASFMKKYEAVRTLLNKQKIRWEFQLEPALQKSCKLSQGVIMATPGILGFVDQVHWALKSLIVQEDLRVAVDRVRVIVTAKKNIELYETNRAVKTQLNEKGERVLDFFVNLGDPQAGISFTSLMKNFTDRSLVYQEGKILRGTKAKTSLPLAR